ncbi:MAG: hypothetical protein CEE40_03290 [Chloroflexi bacterium B3_Chlor]|nr:MAG: hypothetical protein CEE40_03290 [Chloroflexi bacterium B3_Chlor]
MTIYDELRARIEAFLGARSSFIVAEEFRRSTRGVGDAIERLIVDEFADIATGLVDAVDTDFGRRAMEDLSFRISGQYYAVDVKTHREEPGFHMPNLTSVKRLMDFYEDDNNYFVVVMIRYRLTDTGSLEQVTAIVEPVEWFDWDCLRIGALGWGQLQFRSASDIRVNRDQTREDWLHSFARALREHYAGEENKIKERMEYLDAFIEKKLR